MSDPLIAFEDKNMNPLPLKGHMQMTNMVDVNKAIIDQFFVGKIIRVYWSSVGHQLNADGHYVTSLCVKGELEERGNWYRVLVDDDTYTYFDYMDILTMAVRSKESKRPNSISLKSSKNW